MKNLQLTELQPLIIEWAKNRNLVFPENSPKQRLKLIEECGELAQAILKNDVQLQKDAVGDIFVVLVILAEQTGEQLIFKGFTQAFEKCENADCIYDILSNAFCESYNCIFDSIDWLQEVCVNLKLNLTECANIAWNEIKNRTGQTVNGTFIKD